MSITIIMGPMFSGKTGDLLAEQRKHNIVWKGKSVLVKPKIDTRSEDVGSHDGIKKPADFTVYQLSEIKEIIGDSNKYSNIFIDEGQFFEDLAEVCSYWESRGKKVFVSALSGTYQRKMWKSVVDLLPLCSEVRMKYAVCNTCGAKAAFSKRLYSSDDVIGVGGSERYRAVCSNPAC